MAPKISEAKYQRNLSNFLREKGWTTELEKQTSWGVIDIYATCPNGKVFIIETKRYSTLNYISSAYGQLSFYSLHHKDAVLVIATPSPTKKELRMSASLLPTQVQFISGYEVPFGFTSSCPDDEYEDMEEEN